MQSFFCFLYQFWTDLARNAEPFSASCIQESIKGEQGDYLRPLDDEMSFKEKTSAEEQVPQQPRY